MGAAFVARLSIGVYGLAIVLHLRETTGSYATAGAVAAAFAAGLGAGQPGTSRLVDRLGRVRVVPVLAAVHVVAILGLLALSETDAPAAVLIAVALLAGLAEPPLGSITRTLWPKVLQGREGLLTTAFALDGVVTELAFVTGPLFVAVVVAVASPALALVACTVSVTVGIAWFLSIPLVRDAPVAAATSGSRLLGALVAPGLRTLVLCALPIGFTFGAVEVVLPAFAEHEGHRGTAGLLVAAWAAASAAGGLAYGAVEWHAALPARFVRFAVVLPAGYLLVAAAWSIPTMAVLVAVAGVLIAPTLTAISQLAGEVAPPGRETEAFAWPTTALILGIAAGNAAAGAIVEAEGWQTAVLVAAGAAVLGAVAAVARRDTLAGAQPV
ncbi:MFS transporter [Conexibacter sp. SYSU D00693]|uniref:MFS transporter n=1 Tax=Conexibacter sp. SYSU D00693 TaxID=2812560 RepID=UPI00196A3B19|nr:MFS transporter [Conexibacter sp. SYSU D00693]